VKENLHDAFNRSTSIASPAPGALPLCDRLAGPAARPLHQRRRPL